MSRRAVRAARLSRRLGPAADARGAAGVRRRPQPGQARARSSRTLLADDQKYAEHWISFWNDLLRNEDGVSYFSETAGRKSITDWLLAALGSNLPYDQFVTRAAQPDRRRPIPTASWSASTGAARRAPR